MWGPVGQWPLGQFAVTLILALGSVLLGILLLFLLFCFWSVWQVMKMIYACNLIERRGQVLRLASDSAAAAADAVNAKR